ncbi:hypothetical protein DL93DRAFT_2043986, partial [Clavulina sp. PMI_390]
APAAEVLTHKHRLSKRFTEISPYHGSRTEERDLLWANLYMPYTWVGLPREMVEALPNRTERIQDDVERLSEPRYLVDLDVFHQLHCLVSLQCEVHTHDILPLAPSDDPTYDHIDHCLNSIRESLM